MCLILKRFKCPLTLNVWCHVQLAILSALSATQMAVASATQGSVLQATDFFRSTLVERACPRPTARPARALTTSAFARLASLATVCKITFARVRFKITFHYYLYLLIFSVLRFTQHLNYKNFFIFFWFIQNSDKYQMNGIFILIDRNYSVHFSLHR